MFVHMVKALTFDHNMRTHVLAICTGWQLWNSDEDVALLLGGAQRVIGDNNWQSLQTFEAKGPFAGGHAQLVRADTGTIYQILRYTPDDTANFDGVCLVMQLPAGTPIPAPKPQQLQMDLVGETTVNGKKAWHWRKVVGPAMGPMGLYQEAETGMTVQQIQGALLSNVIDQHID